MASVGPVEGIGGSVAGNVTIGPVSVLMGTVVVVGAASGAVVVVMGAVVVVGAVPIVVVARLDDTAERLPVIVALPMKTAATMSATMATPTAMRRRVTVTAHPWS